MLGSLFSLNSDYRASSLPEENGAIKGKENALYLKVAFVAGAILGSDLLLAGLVLTGLVTLPFILPIAIGFLTGIAVIAAVIGIAALSFYALNQARHSPTALPASSAEPIFMSSSSQKADWKNGVWVNSDVFDTRCSDHAIIGYNTQQGIIISSNVMCSGERRQNPQKTHANSYGIEPTDPNGRLQRFDNMIAALYLTAETAQRENGQAPIIALQEFPRNNSTGSEEFVRRLERTFPTYSLYFGPVEEQKQRQTGMIPGAIQRIFSPYLSFFGPTHEEERSQLCILVPKDRQVKLILDTPDTRIQAVIIDQVAYVNIHPAPAPKSGSDDFQQTLLDFGKALISTSSCQSVHIVGDWNRKRRELNSYWADYQIDTPGRQSHLPPLGFHSIPGPVDHHVNLVT